MMRRIDQIASAFAGASAYHQQARVQKMAARNLLNVFDETLGDNFNLKKPHILELGCGSGFLSQQLLQRWPGADLLITDLTPTMLTRCRRHLAGDLEKVRFQVLDGQRLSRDSVRESSLDLIAAGMVFQNGCCHC